MEKVFQIQDEFKPYESDIRTFIENFGSQGKTIYKGSRNELRTKTVNDISVNIKRFQVPNWVNQFAYRWVRDSKAKRSFDFAATLLKIGVNTPKPIAYQENFSTLGILNSFYVSIQQDHDLTIRELTYQPDIPGREKILRDFTRFTHHFQDQGIFFIDHSPGNTLIKRMSDNEFEFFLVDLNRMKFKTLNYKERVKNFARLSPDRDIYVIIADEYAKMINKDSHVVFDDMWAEVKLAREKMKKKQNLKKKMRLKKSNYQ